MTYTDCQKIVDNTKPLFVNTPFTIDYYLDGEPYFLKDGEVIEWDELPEQMKVDIGEILDVLEIEY